MATRRSRKVEQGTLGASRSVEDVWISLLEMFASVDDVMTEAGAFDPEHIHKSLGRIYRQWLNSREILDPEFDRARYRHAMKSRKKTASQTPLGRALPVSTQQSSSTARMLTSGKKPKLNAKPEKKSAKRSAKGAQSVSRASGGRSIARNSSESGAGSPSGSATGSESGSSKRATRRSPKGKG